MTVRNVGPIDYYVKQLTRKVFPFFTTLFFSGPIIFTTMPFRNVLKLSTS